MASPWQPRTEQQREAVKKIARPEVEGFGGLVRSLPDGNDELLVKFGGAVRRYLVAEDGSSRLVHEQSPPPNYEWAHRLFWVGSGLFVLGVVLWMALPGGPHLWTFLLVPAAFATIYAGARYSPNLKRHTEAGERWQRIGDLSNL